MPPARWFLLLTCLSGAGAGCSFPVDDFTAPGGKDAAVVVADTGTAVVDSAPRDSAPAVDAMPAMDSAPVSCSGGSGKYYCGSNCIDPKNDPDNCGWCFHKCSSGKCKDYKCE